MLCNHFKIHNHVAFFFFIKYASHLNNKKQPFLEETTELL